MSDEARRGRDPFGDLVLDEDFVRGGRHEPPARTRQAIARWGGGGTSFRYAPPSDAVVRARPGVHASSRSARAPVSVIFFALVAAVVVALLACWESRSRFAVFVAVVVGWLLSLCLHEFAHAAVAYRAGDRSETVKGYLRLDIRRYAHPITSFVMPVLFVLAGGIGLPGGAVWLDHAAFRTRRMRSLSSLAGPAANGACALLCLMPLAVASRSPSAMLQHLEFWSAVAFLGFLQICAVIINLLPIPGLDGWGVVEPYLPHAMAEFGRKIAPFGMLILFLVLVRSGAFSGQLGSTISHIERAFGVSPGLAAIGYRLFHFWS